METSCPQAVFAPIFMCAFIFFGLAIKIIVTLIVCKIFSKAGFHWALGLITLVPFGGMIMLLYFAFSEWPIERRLKAYQQGTPPTTPFQA